MTKWNFLAIVIALASAIFTLLLWLHQRKSMFHQALMDVQKEYRSAEMLYAVRELWNFYRTHPKDELVKEYERIRLEDEQRISALDKLDRLKHERNTLHYYRRLVSHFYHHLGALLINGILPRDIIFRSWSESDLRIIPEILVPIENNLRAVLHEPPKRPLDEKHPLVFLYEQARMYEVFK